MTTTPSNPAGQPRKRPSRASGAGGAKMLITAASLAAVVGGWTVLTLQQAESAGANPAAVPVDEPADEEMVMDLPPLPTLIPEPAALQAPSGVTLANSPGVPAGAGLGGSSLLTGGQPAVQPGLPKSGAPKKKKEAAEGSSKPAKPKAEKPKADGGTQSSR